MLQVHGSVVKPRSEAWHVMVHNPLVDLCFTVFASAAQPTVGKQHSIGQHSTAEHSTGQPSTAQRCTGHTSSMSGSFQAPAPANLDNPTVLSRHRRILSQEAAMSAVVLQELATCTRRTRTAGHPVTPHWRQCLSVEQTWWRASVQMCTLVHNTVVQRAVVCPEDRMPYEAPGGNCLSASARLSPMPHKLPGTRGAAQ